MKSECENLGTNSRSSFFWGCLFSSLLAIIIQVLQFLMWSVDLSVGFYTVPYFFFQLELVRVLNFANLKICEPARGSMRLVFLWLEIGECHLSVINVNTVGSVLNFSSLFQYPVPGSWSVLKTEKVGGEWAGPATCWI